MALAREDADMAKAELEADPERWQLYRGAQGIRDEYQRYHRDDTRPDPLGERVEAAEEPQEEGEEEEEEEEEEEAEHLSPTTTRDSASRRSMGPRQRSRHYSTVSLTSTRFEKDFMDYLDRHPTAIKRIQDHRLHHCHTVGSARSVGDVDLSTLPQFGGGKPYPPTLPEREEYVVEFDGHDDPAHAQNWPLRTKLTIAAILILDSLAATFASSVFSPASTAVGAHFHIGRDVVRLGTSLFVLGYACGPIIFAPISELYGRRLPIIVAGVGFGIFNIAVAVSKDVQTLMIARFFAGFFGSCPLTVVAAVFSDMFNNELRGIAVASFSATVICGPFTGPFIGGFITKSYLGWRWTAYIPAFMGFAAAALALFFQKESYGPVILVSKASELRRKTRNWGIHAKQEEVEVDLKELLTKNISRPLRILFTEPIVLLITIYMSFIYGLLYLNLTAYSLVFSDVYGFSLGVSGLPYIALILGVAVALAIIVLTNPAYVRKLHANDHVPVPEWRLPIVMAGGVVFAAGLLWFGWAGFRASTPWIAPALAGLFIGFGIYSVFLQCLNYIIDAYLMFAASAIAANTIMRSTFGAIFPLFAAYLFDGLGINWSMTLLGCVAALFTPIPFVFYFYGKRIRARSRFAPAPDLELDRKRRRGARDEEEAGSGSGSEGKEE
ncbi:Major Facilitator Superfamily [Teratosphaeria destructans]|uniref:Cercosporin MFS transporter CTB4 n=1 Tax=Teratosphaeria destructans TaxID=418781 RepID=A0A9W7SS34_9PEZI|nr:Major Facilitator Superfamily [Teratosphaeria destructans]